VANERLRLVTGHAPRPVTLVDSCVLLDLALEDAQWLSWSAGALAAAADEGPLAINPVIYAEVSVGYRAIEEADAFLPAGDYQRQPLPYAAGFLAGKAFATYRRAGGTRQSPLPDFYIGAHAAVAGYRLLTRDRARYATYFPKVTLIAPDQA
jgi:predicted nucleic acid-binding protein